VWINTWHVERRTRVNSHLNGLINNFYLNRVQIGWFSHPWLPGEAQDQRRRQSRRPGKQNPRGSPRLPPFRIREENEDNPSAEQKKRPTDLPNAIPEKTGRPSSRREVEIIRRRSSGISAAAPGTTSFAIKETASTLTTLDLQAI